MDRKLAERFGSVKASWAKWKLDRVLRIFLDAAFAGVERIWHFADLETEPLLCALHGAERLPDVKTLYRELRRFEDPELLASLHGLMREEVQEALAGQDRVVLELDSTVETLYGRQEGAEVGPNPHKPGRPSYHPLLARERISDLIVHHKLRPGSAGTATGLVEFLGESLDIVTGDGKKREVLVRMDRGFESGDALDLLEKRGVGYVVKMRASWGLFSFAARLAPNGWTRVETEQGEVRVTSFLWKRPTSWTKFRRVVVMRKKETDSLQGNLFDELGWSYALYVTDRDWAEEDVVRFYDKRADIERTICETKNDLSIDHVPTASFGANAADLALKILARNLLVLYRTHALHLTTRIRVMTLRRRFLHVAGRVVRRAGRWLLRLSPHSPLRLTLEPIALRC
jgi:hypothetical protein